MTCQSTSATNPTAMTARVTRPEGPPASSASAPRPVAFPPAGVRTSRTATQPISRCRTPYPTSPPRTAPASAGERRAARSASPAVDPAVTAVLLVSGSPRSRPVLRGPARHADPPRTRSRPAMPVHRVGDSGGMRQSIRVVGSRPAGWVAGLLCGVLGGTFAWTAWVNDALLGFAVAGIVAGLACACGAAPAGSGSASASSVGSVATVAVLSVVAQVSG